MDLLKNPLYNSIISGIIIYFLITISNKGNPVLGAILSSLPIGVISLLAIKKQNNIQEFYIRSELATNFIIIVMWIVINYLILKKHKHITNIALIGILVWISLSILFYHIATSYLPS